MWWADGSWKAAMAERDPWVTMDSKCNVRLQWEEAAALKHHVMQQAGDGALSRLNTVVSRIASSTLYAAWRKAGANCSRRSHLHKFYGVTTPGSMLHILQRHLLALYLLTTYLQKEREHSWTRASLAEGY